MRGSEEGGMHNGHGKSASGAMEVGDNDEDNEIDRFRGGGQAP